MKHRTPHISWLAAVLGTFAVPAAATDNFVTGRTNWLAARYPAAVPPLTHYRNEPKGRTAEVDYMLGTSGCRIAARRAWGARLLNFALYSYPLTGASRATIMSERDRCLGSGAMGALTSEQRLAVNTVVIAGATARGKMFVGDGVAFYPAHRTRELTAEEKAGRLFPLGLPKQAAIALQERARRLPALTGGKVHIGGHFAILTTAGQNDAELAQMSDQLERYISFLQREYSVSLPNQYITLYLVDDIDAVQAVADQVHGLDVSRSTLGYSFQDDLSAVGMIRGTQSGTLMHELFHLLVRSSFGDIPQWLDEGVASLYEVSAERGDRYVGLPNWRGRVLANSWDMRPSLANVISSPWFAFDRTDDHSSGFMMPAERTALHLATARYLVLYLQDKGLLRSVFQAFRDRDPGEADDPGTAAVTIVERGIGALVLSQPDYDKWLRQVVRKDDTNQPDTPGKTLPSQPLNTCNNCEGR